MSKIKVLLIEDNRLLREGITAMLNEQEDIRADSSSGTNRDTVKKATSQRPHVVLLDIGLKNQNSLKLAEQIRIRLPRTELVVMDLIPAHHDVVEFVKAGISGYIKKDALVDDMLNTIRKVAKGKKVLPSSSKRSLFSEVVEHSVQNGATTSLVDSIKMSQREQKVIAMLSHGKSHKDIATKLKLTVAAVNGHVLSVFEKLALYIRLEQASFSLTRDGTGKKPTRNSQSTH